MARLLRATTVVRDGFHNAFTDLVYWQDAYWVSYRRGTGHVCNDAEAVLAVSSDRERFREMGRLRIAGDIRDPKMVVMSDDRLAVIAPSWLGRHSKRNLQQFVTFTEDGINFDKPTPILERNQWLWRVVKHGEKYYGAAYDFPVERDARPYILGLMVSNDMVHWDTVSRIADDSVSLGEAGLYFQSDGELWVVGRQNKDNAVFAAAKPPYTHWETHDLGMLVHSPAILEHKGVVYLAGRYNADVAKDELFPYLSRMGLAIWRLERGKIKPVLHMPAAGDCAYPGFIVDPKGRVCMSYYSQHAYLDGTLPPPYRLDTEPKYDKGSLLSVADVYFAELDLG